MKKITFLLLFLIGITGQAQILNQPANWPNPNWTLTGIYSSSTANLEANPTISSNFSYDDNENGFGLSSLISAESPIIDLTTAHTSGENWITVIVDYRYNEQVIDDLELQYWNTDTSTWVTWHSFDTDTPNVYINHYCNAPSVSFTSDILDITNFTATQLSGFRYRFYFNDNGGWVKGFCFDSPTIYSEAPPSCMALDINNITITNITDTSVSINWLAGVSNETSWEVVVLPQGTGEPTNYGSGLSVSLTPTITYPGLSENTPYDIYIAADCGSGDYSYWVGPVNFTTLLTPPTPPSGVTCTANSASYIFLEEFNEPGNWTGALNTGNGSWEIPNGSVTQNTGPETAYSGAHYMNFEATGASGVTASIVSPAIDLTGATGDIELSFYMYAYGAQMGTLEVAVGMSPSGPFTNVFTWVGQYQTSSNENWIPVGIDLTSYTNQSIYLQFKQTAPNSGYNANGDMAIDYLRVQTCGEFCIPPFTFNLDNITDITANISWVPNSNETSWLFFVQIAGSGPPIGTGATVTGSDPQLFIDGLSADTSYELYIMPDCGDGFYGQWSAPYTFTTPVKTDYIVDCSSGTTDISYCYSNNDTTTFTFTSSDGVTPLDLLFTSGTIQVIFDMITITDGNGNNLYTGYGNNGDLSNLDIHATTPTISVTINSDPLNSCESGEQTTPWEFQVSCSTCSIQTVDYNIISTDCDNENEIYEFLIDVHISDMGGANSITLSDNQGSLITNITTTGTYTLGPYNLGTEVIASIINDNDPNCTISSPILTTNDCSPVFNPLCETISAGDDATYNCTDSGITLEASFITSGNSTSTYYINSTDCSVDTSEGTTNTLPIDDYYSDIIDIGFNFCFFGNTYNQAVVGPNGILSFNTNLAGTDLTWFFSQEIPNPNLPTNAIFGVFQDINPSFCGSIEYTTSGTAPNRKFKLNFIDVCHFSCSNLTSTTQIVLHESTNAIDINIINKPDCSWNSGNSIAGIQDSTGTLAYTPPGRNTSAWSAQNEFWRFVPAGSANYTFEWFEGTTSLGTSTDITVYPSATTTYTAQVNYTLCDGSIASITDDVTITVDNTTVPDAFTLENATELTPVTINNAGQIGDSAYNFSAYTPDNLEPIPSCFTNGISASGWYSFVAPEYGEVTINAYVPGTDHVALAVYDATSAICTNLPTYNTEIACEAGSNTIVFTGENALTENSTYFIQVANTPNNVTTYGIEVVNMNTAKNEDITRSTFKYYPNPVNQNILYIEAEQAIETIEVYNMLGQILIQQIPNTTKTDINMQNLAKGQYFVKVTVGNNSKVVQIMKE